MVEKICSAKGHNLMAISPEVKQSNVSNGEENKEDNKYAISSGIVENTIVSVNNYEGKKILAIKTSCRGSDQLWHNLVDLICRLLNEVSVIGGDGR